MPPRLAVIPIALCLSCGGSPETPPTGLAAFLPTLPAAGGAPGAEAGVVTDANRAAKLPGGDAAKGRPGDFYLENARIRLLVQAPGRYAETLPYGGNAMNLELKGAPSGTQFGEMAPFFNAAHTANFTRVEVVRDGKAGGPAVIRATGTAALLDYFNLASFVSGLDIIGFDTDEPPPLDVAATYIVPPGDKPWVQVVYTLYNRTDAPVPVSIGTFTDTGGNVEYFAPGAGYGQAAYSDLAAIVSGSKPLEYWVGHGVDSAYGVLPAAHGLAASVPNTGLAVAGQAIAVYDAATLLEAVSTTKITLPAKGGRSFETYLLAAESPGHLHGAVLELKGRTAGALSGRVLEQGGGAVAGARVAVLNAQNEVVTVFQSAADGTFAGKLEPGSYVLVADKTGWPRSSVAAATVAAGATATADLTLGRPARVAFRVVDGAGRSVAAKIHFVGENPAPPEARFRDPRDRLGRGLARVAFAPAGADATVEVIPGEYRVVVTRGNEYATFDRRLTFAAGDNARVDVTLHRVLDTPGYLACDFHQHGVNSPDAHTPMRERVLSYLAAGVEFIGSSDHDYLTDYGPTIAAMGAQEELGSMVGVETTPFDYGHYNAFPLPIQPALPNNGALDWGGGDGLNLSPGRIFRAFRDMGAEVVQVNHARATDARRTPVAGFQAYFDRAALTYDFTTGTFFGDAAHQPLPNEVLRIAIDEPLWSDDFDTLEIYNGFSISDYDQDGEADDERVDLLLRDWFNLLSLGKIVTPVGNSDSHGYASDPIDAPRTYVRVPNDARPGAVPAADVLAGLKAARDTVVTNGPFLTLHVNDDPVPAMGRTIAATSGRVKLTVKVQAPAWMHLDQVKIFSNNTYRIPPAGPRHDPMSPRRVVRLSEAQTPGTVRLQRVVVAGDAARWEATVEIPDFELPTPGKDAWVVALVRGARALYPMVPSAVGGSIAELMAGTPSGGVFPLAFTSAAFLDRDGNGRYDAPMR